MTNEQFRPCPGCGGRNIDTVTWVEIEIPTYLYKTVLYRTLCKNEHCGAYTDWFKTPEEAHAAWNLRPEGE